MLNKQLSKNKISAMLIYVVINIIFMFFLDTYDVRVITVISLFQLTLNVIISRFFGYTFFSLPILFIIFTYIFHAGQLILNTFNIIVEKPFDIINMVSDKIYIESSLFFVYSQMLLVFGIIFPSMFKQKEIINIPKNDNLELLKISKIGSILIILGFIPRLYIDISKIILYMKGGYLDTYLVGASGILQVIANFTEIGIMMLLIGNKKNKKKVNNTFVIAILYQILLMFTGNRIYQIVTILSYMYIYIFVCNNRMKLSKIMPYIFFSWLGITFLKTISTIRSMESINLAIITSELVSTAKNKPLFSALGEFGGTMISLAYSIIFFPKVIPYNYGITYIQSFLTLLPNFGGFLNSYNTSFIYINNFPPQFKTSLGGSYLGELFFNFGNFGIFMAFFIGIFIGKIGKNISVTIENGNWISLSLYMIMFPNIMIWVRGYFSDMLRQIIWTSIIILVINYVFKKNRKKNNKKINNL